MSLSKEDYQTLKRPFTPEAVQFRIADKTKDDKKVRILTYIDSRLAVERISEVDFNWTGYPSVLGGMASTLEDAIKAGLPVVYELTVKGVTRADVGQIGPAMYGSNKGEFVPDEKHAKMAVSDALKRSAVLFGVGTSLYCLGNVYAVVGEHTDPAGKYLNAKGKQFLREQYRKTISKPAFVQRFGEPLAHGEELAHEDSTEATSTSTQTAEAPVDSGRKDVAVHESPPANDSEEPIRLKTAAESPSDGEVLKATGLSKEVAYELAIGDLAELNDRSREAAVLYLNSKKNKKVILKNTAKKLVEKGLDGDAVTAILEKHGLKDLAPALQEA